MVEWPFCGHNLALFGSLEVKSPLLRSQFGCIEIQGSVTRVSGDNDFFLSYCRLFLSYFESSPTGCGGEGNDMLPLQDVGDEGSP